MALLGIAIFILISSEAFSAAEPQDYQHMHTACSGLQMITNSKAKIEGVFCNPLTMKGVRFLSEVSEQGTGQFLVTGLQGDPLIAAEKPYKHTATLMTILGKHFLVKENQDPLLKFFRRKPAVTEHLIPEQHLEAVKAALYLQDESSLDSYLESEEATVQEEARDTFVNLLNSAQVQLIREAAEALGRTGVNGKYNQAARVFYVYAMRLVDARGTLLGGRVSAKLQSIRSKFSNMINGIVKKRKPKHGANLEQCTTYPTECPPGQCPEGNQCLGMCGPMCISPCWKFVCGDCCHHEGCYSHDICCGKKNMTKIINCYLKVPFKFHCDKYVTC